MNLARSIVPLSLACCVLAACSAIPTSWSEAPADPTLTCRLANASICAYNVASAADRPQTVEGCDAGIMFQDGFPVGNADVSGVHAYVAGRASDGAVIIAFRGTLNPVQDRQDGIRDWLNDADAARFQDDAWQGKYGYVHKGFWDALDAVWPELAGLLVQWNAQQPITRLYVTGHSKGGAVAPLAALRIRNELSLNAAAVYIYEAARPGTTTFRAQYRAAGIPTYRFENAGDVVPHLPPNADDSPLFRSFRIVGNALTPFVPVGLLYYNDWDGNLKAYPEETTQLRAYRYAEFRKRIGQIDLQDLTDPSTARAQQLAELLATRHTIRQGAGSTLHDTLCAKQ